MAKCGGTAPFESIESAQEYLALLAEVVRESQQITEANIVAEAFTHSRHVDALRLIQFKLDKLAKGIKSSRRILSDLRMLRRLIRQEIKAVDTIGGDSSHNLCDRG
jgi:hypothetical protein